MNNASARANAKLNDYAHAGPVLQLTFKLALPTFI